MPASESVMTTPRNTPAITRRVIAPVIRTLSVSPKRVGCRLKFVTDRPGSCLGIAGSATGGTLVG
jgi:hypothetical protein